MSDLAAHAGIAVGGGFDFEAAFREAVFDLQLAEIGELGLELGLGLSGRGAGLEAGEDLDPTLAAVFHRVPAGSHLRLHGDGEEGLPVVVAEDGDAVAAFSDVVVGSNQAAEMGLDAKDIEVVAGDELAAGALHRECFENDLIDETENGRVCADTEGE